MSGTGNRIAVLGAGSFGTALAIHLSAHVPELILWGHDPAHLQALAATRENAGFLPGFRLPDNIIIESDLATALQGTGRVLLVIPSHGIRGLLQRMVGQLPAGAAVFWATKGFELESGKLLHEVIEDELPGHPYGVFSGPTFAIEVARGQPAAIVCAGNDAEATAAFAALMHGDHIRCYTSSDVVGVELGGALKNVLAIAVGVADGLGFGANTRAALITRGLAEMMRLAMHIGAQQETLMGLAGLGDLILTCTDNQSRNRRFGLALGQGNSIEEAMASIGQTVEGYRAAKAVVAKAELLGVEVPIMRQVYEVLYEGKPPLAAVGDLESRPPKSEGLN